MYVRTAAGWCLVFGFLLAARPAQAQVGATNPPPVAGPPGGLERLLGQTKHPVEWLTLGGDLRVRNEYYDNIVALSATGPLHDQDVIRTRARLWTSVVPVTDLSLNGRVSAEPREWMRPAFVGTYPGQTGMEWRYGIADSLNLKWTNAFQQPLSITAGRQDLLLGDYWSWWLVADGTPLDGSWTFYLDSLRAAYEAKELKTKFDLVYIYQNAYADEWLPTLNNQHVAITEQTEQGVILYASNKSLKNTTLDGYFIYKGDDRELANGDDADIYTIGGRVAGVPGRHWHYLLEGAYQFGEKQDPTVKRPVNLGAVRRDIDAFGANGRLSYLIRDSLDNQFHFVFEFLSGDNPNSQGKDEMFDILWGRWPRWSELYIYSYIKETGNKIAQLNDIGRVGTGWSMVPTPGMNLALNYNAWFAPESVPTRAVDPALFTGTGNFRGHYLQATLTHQFNKHIKGHLWAEEVFPGDFYAQRDLLTFLRAEVTFTW